MPSTPGFEQLNPLASPNPHLTVGGSLASFNGPAGNGAGPATGSMIFKELLDMLDCLFSIPALEPYLEPYIDSYIRPYTDLFDIYRQDSYPSTNGNKDDSASSSSSSSSSTASSSVESPDENSDSSQKSAKSPPPYVTLDPIQLLWDIFRQGVPLCILFNALGRDPQLDTTIKETEKLLTERKKKVYMFVKACKDSQIVKEDQLFTTSELFKDDTNSFVRVLRTLNVVINELKANPTDSIDMAKLESRPVSWILDEGKNYPRDNRWMAVNELLNTERKYLQDLEVLQGYMHRLQGRNVVSSDTIRYMFANLNYIVDFSRRLLIRLESTACLPPPCQRFGAIFIEMEEGFAVYEPYTSNYNRANAICVDEAQVLAQMSDPIEPHYMLPSMLIKPVQRVCKYTLLLREISRHSKDTYPQSISELQEGYESVNRMVNRANESKRLEENQSIAKDLEERVEDWKGYNPGEFGVLHLYGDFKMSTSDTTRELRIYLFDEILVLVKEVAERERRRSTQSQQNRKPPPLQLKGRIFLDTIHRVVDTSREGSLSLTIYWRDVVMENFSIECTNDEQLRLWKTSMDELVAKARHKANLRHNKNTPTNDNLVITRSRAPPYSAHTPTSRFEASLNAAVAAASLSSLSSSSAGSNSAGAVAKPLQYRKTYDGSSKASSVSTVKSHKLFRSGTADPTPEHITELSKTMERALNYTTAQDQQTSVT
ncbi:Guanine nucleotide exchange factor for Cdc42p, partial [Spiromyces aspiralis]